VIRALQHHKIAGSIRNPPCATSGRRGGCRISIAREEGVGAIAPFLQNSRLIPRSSPHYNSVHSSKGLDLVGGPECPLCDTRPGGQQLREHLKMAREVG
jgi:hypothetical protein